MRTTLTLDPDVVQLLKEAVARERKPFKQVVNESLRRGLLPVGAPARRRYRVRPHVTRLRAGIDPNAFNRLADELEDDEILSRRRS